MLYLMDLTLTTNITSKDSLVGAPLDTNRFSILERKKEFTLEPDRAPISFFWTRNTNRVLTGPPPVFSRRGKSSPSPNRTQLEIRKDRAISTREGLNVQKL